MSNRISNTIREPSPCKDCTERFTACQDRCPKDARGKYGIMAWKAEIARVKKVRKDYLDIRPKRGRHYWKEI